MKDLEYFKKVKALQTNFNKMSDIFDVLEIKETSQLYIDYWNLVNLYGYEIGLLNSHYLTHQPVNLKDKIYNLKDKIYNLKDNIDRVTKVFDVLQPTPESDIHECYWGLVESYIDEIDTSPRDSSGYNWLGWFIFENNWGENDLEIKLSGGEWEKVKTIEDMVRIIESQ